MKTFLLFIPLLILSGCTAHPNPEGLKTVQAHTDCKNVGEFAVDEDGILMQCSHDEEGAE